ncbi:unnamed protein product [Paramecium primaurelia]|uniref:Splicing factor 3A subunit 1 conserved domain-containing protein n=1 Tax=Paramecium primaurelia TaxID=5886 RepID=A0A8S1M5R2_PARPR|nr:unnamed protein product [Paramecium primaurelia]
MESVNFAGDNPQPRFGHTICVIAPNKIALFGGAVGDTGRYVITGDVYIGDIILKKWKRIEARQVVSRIINNPQQPKEKQVITLNSTLQKAGQQGDSSAPIISNYQRPTTQNELVLIKCEICGKNFPKNQINEHIQLELQDPRYSEIKKEINERSKTTTLQPGNMIAEHLSQLKKKRPDIFEEDHRKPPPPPPPQQRPQPPRPAPPPPPPPPK